MTPAMADLGTWEREVLHWLTCRWHAPWLGDLLEFAQTRPVAVAYALLAGGVVALRSPARGLRAVAAAGLGVGVALLLGTAIWLVVDRDRPQRAYERVLTTPEDLAGCAEHPEALALRSPGSRRPSFPSHHALTAGAFAAAFWLAWRPLGAVTWLLALVVGWARLYFGKHWPTDVLGGLALGALCGWAAWPAVPRIFARLRLGRLNERAPPGAAGGPG